MPYCPTNSVPLSPSADPLSCLTYSVFGIAFSLVTVRNIADEHQELVIAYFTLENMATNTHETNKQDNANYDSECVEDNIINISNSESNLCCRPRQELYQFNPNTEQRTNANNSPIPYLRDKRHTKTKWNKKQGVQ